MSTVEWIKINGKWVEKSVIVENGDCSSYNPKDDLLVNLLVHANNTNEVNVNAQGENNFPINDEMSVTSDESERSVASIANMSLPSNASWHETMENRLRTSENRLRTSSQSSMDNMEPQSTNTNINERLSKLECNELKFYSLLDSLKSELDETRTSNDILKQQVVDLEKDLARLDQYGRRQNIELAGVPNSVSDKALEKEVIKILHKIGMHWIESYSIVGCHRIGGKDRHGARNVIVRFLHRKDSEAALKRKRDLVKCNDIGYSNIYMSENLCPAFRSVLKDLNNLKRAGHIGAVWVTNGTIKYKIEDKESVKPEKIFHKSDVSELKSYLGVSP